MVTQETVCALDGCEVVIPGDSPRKRQYCSNKCRRRARTIIEAAYAREIKERGAVECQWCDAEFTPIGLERACADCRAERLTRTQRTCAGCLHGRPSKAAATGYECRGGIDGLGVAMSCRPWTGKPARWEARA